jgi:tetratricopeptide (TPR) repeat protein
VRLGVGEVNAFRGAGTRNVEAYEAYLEGLYLGAQEQAIPFFERATELDPNYAAAWALLGLRTAGTQWTSNPEEAPGIKERAYAFVRRAVELNPESAQSFSLLGTMLYGQKDWIGAQDAAVKALSMVSDRAILIQYGNLLMRVGRSSAARTRFDEAAAIEPLSQRTMNNRWHVSLALGRPAEARAQMERRYSGPEATTSRLSIAYNEGGAAISNRLSIALNEDGSEEIKAILAAMPPTAISTTALYSPVLGVFNSPERVMHTLRAVYADDRARWPSKLHDIALLAAYFGDPEFALRTIGEEVRNTTVRLQAVWYPVMSEVRQLPEFKELVTDLNLVAYWRAYGWADTCRPVGDDDFTCG